MLSDTEKKKRAVQAVQRHRLKKKNGIEKEEKKTSKNTDDNLKYIISNVKNKKEEMSESESESESEEEKEKEKEKEKEEEEEKEDDLNFSKRITKTDGRRAQGKNGNKNIYKIISN